MSMLKTAKYSKMQKKLIKLDGNHSKLRAIFFAPLKGVFEDFAPFVSFFRSKEEFQLGNAFEAANI